MSTVKHWNRLLRDVESPSLEKVKMHSEEPAMDYFFEQKVGLDTSSSPLQTQILSVSLKTIVRTQQKYRKQKEHHVFS